MNRPERTLRLACGVCGTQSIGTFALAELRVSASGEFEPLACHTCGQPAVVPTAPPWELTPADRTWLRAIRIAVDDDGPRTPEL